MRIALLALPCAIDGRATAPGMSAIALPSLPTKCLVITWTKICCCTLSWGTLTMSSRDCACAKLSTRLSMTLLSPSCFPTSNSGNRRCLGVSARARLQKRVRPAPLSRRNQPACDTAGTTPRVPGENVDLIVSRTLTCEVGPAGRAPSSSTAQSTL